MGTTDDQLDSTSRKLLTEIDALRRLELEKRRAGRSTGEFHALADQVASAAENVFLMARDELVDGENDSPIEAEREEQHPGDWTEGNRN